LRNLLNTRKNRRAIKSNEIVMPLRSFSENFRNKSAD
jgi:hypothetical protein